MNHFQEPFMKNSQGMCYDISPRRYFDRYQINILFPLLSFSSRREITREIYPLMQYVKDS